jgi:hypothetical protein
MSQNKIMFNVKKKTINVRPFKYVCNGCKICPNRAQQVANFLNILKKMLV